MGQGLGQGLGVGDLITGTVHRKVMKESINLVKMEKKTFTCTIKVKSFIYDGENDSLHINGQNAVENKYIGLGAAQSMSIKAPR